MPHECHFVPEDPYCIDLAEKIASCQMGFFQCVQTWDWSVIRQFLPPYLIPLIGIALLGVVGFWIARRDYSESSSPKTSE